MIAVNTELGASLFLSSLVFFSLLLTSNQVDLSWRMPRFSLWLLQFSHSVMSDFLQPHELQHARPPCPSPTPRIYSNSCPLSWWCDPTTSPSVVPFSSHLQYFPAQGSFQMSQLFASGGQSIGVSPLTSVLPVNTQGWSPLGWTGWISLPVQGTLKSLLQPHSSCISVIIFKYTVLKIWLSW